MEEHQEVIQLRRVIHSFESALSLVPRGDHHETLRSLKHQLTQVEKAAVRDSLLALTQLDQLALKTQDECQKIAIREMRVSMETTLMRRLSGVEPKLRQSTRAALWERLWLETDLESTPEERWRSRGTMSIAIARINAGLRDDPLWSPAEVRDQWDMIRAEWSFAQWINQHPRFEGIQATRAPLDADLLRGLDLSLKRTQPRARGWIQFSLSAERELNAQKQRQLKRSAACALLSPWTLMLHGERAYTEMKQRQWWSRFMEMPNMPRSKQIRARLIANQLKLMLNMNRMRAGVISSSINSTEDALCELCADYLHLRLGTPAARRYRHQNLIPSFDPFLRDQIHSEGI